MLVTLNDVHIQDNPERSSLAMAFREFRESISHNSVRFHYDQRAERSRIGKHSLLPESCQEMESVCCRRGALGCVQVWILTSQDRTLGYLSL